MDMNLKISLVFLVLTVISLVAGLLLTFTGEILGIIKPITAFQYCFFGFFAFSVNFLMNKYGHRLTNREVLITIAFLMLMASFYEVLWNFFFWFSNYGFYGINANIDKIQHIPSQRLNLTQLSDIFNLTLNENITSQITKELEPVNLNVVSKISMLIFSCDLYVLYKLLAMKSKSKRNESIPGKLSL